MPGLDETKGGEEMLLIEGKAQLPSDLQGNLLLPSYATKYDA